MTFFEKLLLTVGMVSFFSSFVMVPFGVSGTYGAYDKHANILCMSLFFVAVAAALILLSLQIWE